MHPRIAFTWLAFLCCFAVTASAQRVTALEPGITVDSIHSTQPGATKIARDPLSGNFYYSTLNGNIYEVYVPMSGAPTETLKYTAADHGISSLQGLCFRGPELFICGNVWSATTTVGKVMRGTLLLNGTRAWTAVATTDPYPSSSPNGDHGFTGITVNPTGTHLYVSSGARTHLGEIRTNGGAWPNLREVPLTTRIFRFPIQTTGVVLPNDSAMLDTLGGYLYASGIRNAFSMAWDGDGNLFAIDNSGERDDPEELNWLRPGRHYGYPWRMGGNDNPLQFSPYDVNQDPLVNHLSGGYVNGWFADNPGFPTAPIGLTFTEPVRNYGTVADYFRDPVTGAVRDAGDEGTFITSFTAHRSPTGLAMDRDSLLAAPYKGKAFVLSFMPGGDSSGYTPLSPWGSPCPFVDPSRELVMMNLSYDSGLDNYTMTTENLVTGFYLPVDAALVGNSLYVIENNGDIWRITFPLGLGIEGAEEVSRMGVYPNPAQGNVTLSFGKSLKGPSTLEVYNALGQLVRTFDRVSGSSFTMERDQLPNGLYLLELRAGGAVVATGKVVLQ